MIGLPTKNYMGEDKNTLTHHGQASDSVVTIWVIHPTNHYDHTNLQYL
jgi:hypothetical protein